MSHSAEHLALIIDNLVDLADLEAGQTELRIGYVQVGEVLKTAMEEARVAGRSKRLTVECLDCSDQILKGDEAKIHQALANLLDNAVRFSPHGGVILAELRDRDDQYEISIYDQGSGMDVAQLDRLSRPFSHAAFAYPARRPGAGLGLPVARRIAEAHGGELRAESPP
jgi:signal transduction histidine kinase